MERPSFEGRMQIALVAAGRVGTAVGELLLRRGHAVTGIFSRTPSSAARASVLLDAPVAASLERLPRFDTLLIGASEDGLRELVPHLARLDLEGVSAVHFSGPLGIRPLAPLRERGAEPFALHPVQACPTVEAAIDRLPGSAWGVTCGPEAEGWARWFVAELGGTPFSVSEDARPLWHAGAVVASNGIAALLTLGGALLSRAGVERPEQVLGPLASGTVANTVAAGLGGDALTGPVVRGEADSLQRHLDAIVAGAPESLEGYLLVTRAVVEAAATTGRIDARTEERITRVLAEVAGVAAG